MHKPLKYSYFSLTLNIEDSMLNKKKYSILFLKTLLSIYSEKAKIFYLNTDIFLSTTLYLHYTSEILIKIL